MKRYTLLSLCMILSACSNPSIVLEENVQTDEVSLNIDVRSSENTSIDQYYPLRVFVFNENGEFVSHQEITNNNTASAMLKAGKYNISAFSGLNDVSYSYPSIPTYNDIIGIKNSYSGTHALMSGHYEIELSQSSNVIIPIRYCVSALRFSYSDVPSDAGSVSLSVSPLSEGYTFSGSYTDATSQIKLECTYNNGIWEAGPVYVFPSGSNSILLSVTIDRPDGPETYSYTYDKAILPAVPYSFKGKYNEGFRLDASFEIEGWLPGVDIEYDLIDNSASGNEGADDNQDSSDTEIPTLYSDYLPEPNSFWGSFYVWTTKEISTTEIEALIISPEQWPNILAAEAPDILAEYSQDGISDWRTFTDEETRTFFKTFSSYDDKLGELNKLLSDNGHNYFYCYSGERYLCKNAEYSFCLDGALRITKVGDKAKYYLRPVKTVRIKLN